MTSQNTASALRLRNVLLPWRLAASVLYTEENQEQATRSVFCLMLLTGLFAVFATMFGLMGTDALWTCSVVAAAYCAALLTFSFVILNALSVRR